MKKINWDKKFFEGVVSIEETESGLRLWRIPYKEKKLFYGLEDIAAKQSGIRIRFKTNSSSASLAIGIPDKNIHGKSEAVIDIAVNGKIVKKVKASEIATDITIDNLGRREKLIEFWLDHHNRQMTLKHMLIDEGSYAVPADGRRIKWVTYGSSITQCAEAESPGYTWPAIVARKHDLNLTCLGYGSNCHLEPMVAMMIRDLHPDFISMILSTNALGVMHIRYFQPAVIGMVRIIREKNPATPIAAISPILFPASEKITEEGAFTIVKMRQQLQEAVNRLIDCGDEKIAYFNGLDLLNDEKYLMPDRVHPNHHGYAHMAENFSKIVINSDFLKKHVFSVYGNSS